MIEIKDVQSLADRIGQEVAVSDWLEVTQEQIDQFADTTSDRQWIHVDPERAATESPFKTTIAHGFLTLSLLVPLFSNALQLTGVRMAINYGLNRVRFISPVPAGSRIRGRFTPQAIEEASGHIQVTWSAIVEAEHGTKPSCMAEWIVRYVVPPGSEDPGLQTQTGVGRGL